MIRHLALVSMSLLVSGAAASAQDNGLTEIPDDAGPAARVQIERLWGRNALLDQAVFRLSQDLFEAEQDLDEAQQENQRLAVNVSQLRTNVRALQELLELANEADAETQMQLDLLAERLNAALARVTREQRRAQEAEMLRAECSSTGQALAASLRLNGADDPDFQASLHRLIERCG